MPSTKRSHERGPSLSLRPHKSARSLRDDVGGSQVGADEMHVDDESEAGFNDYKESHGRTLWDRLQMISTSDPLVVPPLHFLGRVVRPLSTFDITGITCWPKSLAVVRNQFRYNIAPQYGRQLPSEVLNLTSWKCMSLPTLSGGSGGPGPARKAPYIHLGFSCWLDLDVYVFLPHCPLDVCIDGDLGRLQEQVLEAWTDRVWLPAIYSGDARAPSSWRMSKQNSSSPLWNDPLIAPFPTYKIYNGSENLGQIWDKVHHNSLAIAQFRDPFLVMHMGKRHPGMFTGQSPELVFNDFEKAWMEEMDTRFVGLDSDNLKITLSCDVVV